MSQVEQPACPGLLVHALGSLADLVVTAEWSGLLASGDLADLGWERGHVRRGAHDARGPGGRRRHRWGDGDGTPTEAGVVSVGYARRGLALEDLTGDVRIDMVVTRFADARMTSYAAEQGQDRVTYIETSTVSRGVGSYSVRLIDIDLDGVLDAVMSISGLGAMGIGLTDGFGQLGNRIAFFTGSSWIDVLVRDFDDGGLPERVAWNAGAQSRALLALLNRADFVDLRQRTPVMIKMS